MSALTDCPRLEDDLLTVRIRNGKEAIAKYFGEDISTWIFTDRRKAEALAKKHGAEWEVCTTPSGQVFYVARKENRAVDRAA